VLLVEDNPDDAALAQLAFARASVPLAVVLAEDGVEALDYLFRRGAHAGRAGGAPDLVLLDLQLPGLDGFEVLRQIRADQALALVPVLAFTSSVEPSDVQRSYRLGANSYLRKPVDFDAFLRLAEQIACYWLTLNQPAPGGASP
jgi:two-component system response regulator